MVTEFFRNKTHMGSADKTLAFIAYAQSRARKHKVGKKLKAHIVIFDGSTWTTLVCFYAYPIGTSILRSVQTLHDSVILRGIDFKNDITLTIQHRSLFSHKPYI